MNSNPVQKGEFAAVEIWNRFGIYINSCLFFFHTDPYGPTRFSIWLPLFRQNTAQEIRQLKSMFYPAKLLADNDTAFLRPAIQMAHE